MKTANSETMAHENDKPMKPLDVTAKTNDDDNTMNWVEPAPHASEDDHTSCIQIYRLLTDAQTPVYKKFTVQTSLLAPVTKEVSLSGGVDLILTQKTNSDIQLKLKILSGETTLTHPVNLMSTFFQKLHKNRKRLENVNGVLYRIVYDHTGQALSSISKSP